MTTEKLQEMMQIIVKQASELRNKHTAEKGAQVNYSAIFSQNQNEYEVLVSQAIQMGRIILDTPTGPVFQISPVNTAAGLLKLLKIRISDKTRPERGDADFTVKDYSAFKKTYLSQDGFKLIKKREDFEMIELMDPEFNVRACFSHPPLDQQLGIS